MQEKSGVIVLDKQAEALITNAALLRAQITEREVQLKVLRISATEQNPAVMRLNSELSGMRGELARMESAQGGAPGSAVDMPVGRLPGASVDYVRARRELKLQETLLEAMVRGYEIAKLDEAKEGPVLQQVDVAQPPDYKSRPSRALIVIASTLVALLLSSAWVVLRRYAQTMRATRSGRGVGLARPGQRLELQALRPAAPARAGCGQASVSAFHSSTSPRMQVTLSPPTQIVVALARDVHAAGAAEPRALRGDVALRRAARADQPLGEAGVEAAGDRIFVDADGVPTKPRTSNAHSRPGRMRRRRRRPWRSASAPRHRARARARVVGRSRAAGRASPGRCPATALRRSALASGAERRERPRRAVGARRPARAQRRRRERRAARRRGAMPDQADAALLHHLVRAAAAGRRARARRGSCRASDGRRTAARRRA